MQGGRCHGSKDTTPCPDVQHRAMQWCWRLPQVEPDRRHALSRLQGQWRRDQGHPCPSQRASRNSHKRVGERGLHTSAQQRQKHPEIGGIGRSVGQLFGLQRLPQRVSFQRRHDTPALRNPSTQIRRRRHAFALLCRVVDGHSGAVGARCLADLQPLCLMELLVQHHQTHHQVLDRERHSDPQPHDDAQSGQKGMSPAPRTGHQRQSLPLRRRVHQLPGSRIRPDICQTPHTSRL